MRTIFRKGIDCTYDVFKDSSSCLSAECAAAHMHTHTQIHYNVHIGYAPSSPMLARGPCVETSFCPPKKFRN